MLLAFATALALLGLAVLGNHLGDDRGSHGHLELVERGVENSVRLHYLVQLVHEGTMPCLEIPDLCF
ncbi:MAG: hypothetical protein EBS90_12945 [Betaproteobacteria bacterium]|nr:hypothetical protein [Betaproteobacteria bacterium]